MPRRWPRTASGVAGLALVAGLLEGACSREPAFLTRTFGPGEVRSVGSEIEVDLARLTYGLDVLRATVRIHNPGEGAVTVDGARATVELEGLHYAASAGSAVVPAGGSAELELEARLGRRLHVPARLVLHGITFGADPHPPLSLQLPPAPRPETDHSGTGP